VTCNYILLGCSVSYVWQNYYMWWDTHGPLPLTTCVNHFFQRLMEKMCKWCYYLA